MTCTTACRKPNGNQAHCGACHETFSGITAFDHHRIGPVDERTCVTPTDCGMHLNAYGVWSQEGGRAYWERPQGSTGTQTAEPVPVGVPA